MNLDIIDIKSHRKVPRFLQEYIQKCCIGGLVASSSKRQNPYCLSFWIPPLSHRPKYSPLFAPQIFLKHYFPFLSNETRLSASPLAQNYYCSATRSPRERFPTFLRSRSLIIINLFFFLWVLKLSHLIKHFSFFQPRNCIIVIYFCACPE